MTIKHSIARSLFSAAGSPSSRRVNVGNIERAATLLGGGALALYGLSRRSLGGFVLALIGGALLYRGGSGHCPIYQALGINTAGVSDGIPSQPDHRQVLPRPRKKDLVLEASEESFPASDPPAWTGSKAGGTRQE